MVNLAQKSLKNCIVIVKIMQISFLMAQEYLSCKVFIFTNALICGRYGDSFPSNLLVSRKFFKKVAFKFFVNRGVVEKSFPKTWSIFSSNSLHCSFSVFRSNLSCTTFWNWCIDRALDYIRTNSNCSQHVTKFQSCSLDRNAKSFKLSPQHLYFNNPFLLCLYCALKS